MDADRPAARYAIDFSSADTLDYVPTMRMRCGLDGAEMFRPDWRMPLNSAQLPFIQQMDGRRSIREIAASVAQAGNSPESRTPHLEKFGRKLFQSLWRLDFLSMALNAEP